ncbi:hypothetical protein DOY81_014649, partial [Sarcophaga bullata]
MLLAPIGILQRLALNESKTGQTGFALEVERWKRATCTTLCACISVLSHNAATRQRSPYSITTTTSRCYNFPQFWFDIYNIFFATNSTQLRSVRQYLREENQRIAETSSAGHFVLTAEQEEAEFQRYLQEKDKWNQEISLIQEQRLAKERQEKEQYVKERLQMAHLFFEFSLNYYQELAYDHLLYAIQHLLEDENNFKQQGKLLKNQLLLNLDNMDAMKNTLNAIEMALTTDGLNLSVMT